MKIALAGHSGFVGSILLEILSPVHEVVTFGRNNANHYFDLRMDFSNLIIDDTFDAVIHAAHDFKNGTLTESIESNALGSLEFLKKSKMSGVRKFIYISSQSAHHDSKSNYGITKYITEQSLAKNSEVIIARLGYVYDQKGNHNLRPLGFKILGATVFPIPYAPRQRYFPTSIGEIANGLDFLLNNDVESCVTSIIGADTNLKGAIARADPRTPKVFLYFPPRLAIRLAGIMNSIIGSSRIGRHLDSLRSLLVTPSQRAIRWQEL